MLWLLNLGLGGSSAESIQQSTASIVIRFRPATDIQTRQRPATQITVRQSMSLHVGDQNAIEADFRNLAGELVDPSSVSIRVQRRATGAAATTYVYGTDANVTRVSLGKFRALIECTAAGNWDFVWISPGPTAKGVEPGWFYVEGTI